MRWQNPPEPRKGRKPDTRTPDQKNADQLRKHPGVWALLEQNAPAAKAYQIKQGQVAAFRPAGAFDAVIRTDDKSARNHGRLYVRFVGEETDE